MHDFLRDQKRCRFSDLYVRAYLFSSHNHISTQIDCAIKSQKTSYFCVTKRQIIGCKIDVREIVYFKWT